MLGLLLLSPLAAQNVGIGTATPSNRLHVHAAPPADANDGQLRISESANDRYMLIGRAATYGFIQTHNNQPLALNPLGNDVGIRTTTPDGRLGIRSGWGNWIGLRDQINDHLYVFHNPASGDRMEVGVYDASAATWRWGVMSITPAGNVGIGTTNPQRRLHVDGTIRATNLAGNHPSSQTYSNVGTNQDGDIIRLNPIHGYLFTVVQPCDFTVEGTIRASITNGNLQIDCYDEGGNFRKTCYTLSGVANARIVLLITNDDTGNCGNTARVSGVRELTVTNNGGTVTRDTDLGCRGSDGNNWTLFIHYNPL